MQDWWSTATDHVERIISTMELGDVLEILIIAFLVYHIIMWIQASRAWYLLKGLAVIGGFLLLAWALDMYTVLWLAENIAPFAVTAIVVVMQPEIRRALEELGKQNVFSNIPLFESSKKAEAVFDEKTMNEIARACVEMAREKTGALIVIEKKVPLGEYERTGIDVDGIVTNQLLINIFEHNTPLHDGAVIVRGNRITSATCYLPLTDNMDLGKELGTRHRAGVGISEVTDALTIIVSEETGGISVAEGGKLQRMNDADMLKLRLRTLLPVTEEEEKGRHRRKGRSKGEK